MAKQANAKSWGLYTHGDGSRRSYPDGILATANIRDAVQRISAAASLGVASDDGAMPWDDDPDDFVMDPARTSNGTGSEASPFQPSQVFARNGTGGTGFSFSGSQIIVGVLPGNCDYTDTRSGGDDFRAPFWRPVVSGNSTNKVIIRGRHNPVDPATDPSDYSSFRRTGGLGSILGFGAPGSGPHDIVLEKLNIPTWAGSDGVNSEVFQYSVWDATRCMGRHIRIDGQSTGAISVPSNNYGGVWHQNTDDCEFMDFLIQNIGSTSGTQIWSAIEHYASQGLKIHHGDIDNVRGQGIFEKGEGAQVNSGNRYHHVHARNIVGNNAALYQFEHYTGTVLADASWWYQNLIRDCTMALKTQSVALPPRQHGVVFVNNTIARCLGYPANPTPKVGFYINNHAHQPLWVVRNNIWDDVGYPYYPEDGSGFTTYNDGMDIDRNRHNGNTGAMSNDGNRSLAYIQSNYGVDVNGQQSSPGFYNAASNDFRRTVDELGLDYLNLKGLGTGGTINQGAFILADQSDRIGRRY